MPRFQWTGLDLEGNPCKGSLECRSVAALESVLAQQEIALIYAKPERHRWRRAWSAQDTLALCSQLHDLLQAGLFVPEALVMIHSYEKNPRRAAVLEALKHHVATGGTLSAALQEQQINDPLTLALITAGQETGNLQTAVGLLVDHLTFQQTFRSNIRSAATMPAISFGFFLVVLCFIVMGLLPRIAALFAQQQCKLPHTTQLLLALSNHPGTCAIFGAVITAACVGIWVSRNSPLLHRIIAHCPGIRSWARQRALISFFTTVSLLAKGNVDLLTALRLGQQSVANTSIRSEFNAPLAAITKGVSLSQALELISWAGHAVTFIAIGEQTGKLAPALEQTAHWYEQRFMKALTQATLYLQPLLIVLMGCCIAGLISAVYMPIISLAGAIKL